MGGRGQGCGSPGEKGAGGVRETGEERAASAREIEKCKLSLFVTAYIQRNCLHTKNVHTAYIQRNEPNNVFRLLFNVLRGLKQNFIDEKSQKTKIRNRDLKKKKKKKKKQHYFHWNWKPFQVAYIIVHEWDGKTHVRVCRLCQSCQCLFGLASFRNSP